jgi:prolyl-tRNA synthetase
VTVTTVADALEAAQTGFARVPWDVVGDAGETLLNRSAVSVRCLIRADGSVPESQDEPGLVAIVARSY